jgi:hypothetical protein
MGVIAGGDEAAISNHEVSSDRLSTLRRDVAPGAATVDPYGVGCRIHS